MSMKYYSLRVREVRRETPDAVSIAFDLPNELRDTFAFTQGQYLAIRTLIDGEDIRRSYSICAGADDGELRIAVKQVPGGRFSTFANERLKAGDTLDVMPPQGRFFTPLDAANKKLYVAFAAGSGITPVLSIIKTTLRREPLSSFVLFYGNRNFDHIIFREELETLKSLYPLRLSVHHVLSRESLGADLFYGRINADKCDAYCRLLFQPLEVDHYFLCGPEEMIFEVKDALMRHGVSEGRILFELFTTPGVSRPAPAPAAEGSDAAITVKIDGMTFDFALPTDGSTLLDAAMRAGADLPFSCKGGVCSTCKARVLEGEVAMDVNYGLEPDEIAAGYVLTCQAHPRSERLVISFDH